MVSDYIKSAAENIETAINKYGCTEDTEAFVEDMMHLHRTLNQMFAHKVVIRFVQRMAENHKSGNFDLRNEAACKACSIMWNALCKAYDWPEGEKFSLPMI